MSECRGCGQKIMWVRMESGKSMPLDPTPLKVAVKNDSDQTFKIVSGYVSHFSTCPNADQFRKGEK